jgi:NADPH2 dehydrogenase
MAGLFSPLRVRALQLKNRLVLPPMVIPGANLRGANERGGVNEGHIQHYVARAQAGNGLIIVEHSRVQPDGIAHKGQLGIYDDFLTLPLSRLVGAVHAAGAAVCQQISHAGAKSAVAISGKTAVAPSEVPPPGVDASPRALSLDEIHQLVIDFGKAARRAVEAGCDAVEIHGAHGYLLSEFLSPLTNHRPDEYGGGNGRIRFPLEVIREVRRVVGPDYPIFYRFGADDLVPGGLTADDARRIAPELVRAGADVLDVSGGLGGPGSNLFSEQGYFVPLAATVKTASNALVVGIGNITEPEYADRVIREGLVDLVAVGRAQLKDANWARAARQTLDS